MHGGRRLGDGTQLHRVRAAQQRRDQPHVRGRTEPSRHRASGRGGQAPGQHLLYGADRDPRADARRRRAGEGRLAQEPAPPRLRGRADQSRGLGVVPPRRGRRTMPGRRYLVADRDRRDPDFAAPRRDRPEGGLRDIAVAGHSARARGRPRAHPRRRGRRQPRPARQLAGQMRTVYGDHQRFIQTYFTHFHGKYFTGDGARRDEDGYWWITGRGRRDQRLWPPPRHGRGRERARRARKSPRPRSSASRTTSRARASMPTSP